MPSTARWLTAAAIFAALGCQDGIITPHDLTTSALDPALAAKARSVLLQELPNFAFLPPIAPPLESTASFDPSLQPEVSVCELAPAGCPATMATLSARLEDDHYHAHWQTSEVPPGEYRVSVQLGSVTAGHADLVVGSRSSGGSDKPDVQLGRTVPIKFWIGVDPLFRAADSRHRGATATEVARDLVPLLPDGCADAGSEGCMEAVGSVLLAAGYGAEEIGEALRDHFEAVAATAQRILELLGFSADELDLVLHRHYSAWDEWTDAALTAAVDAIQVWQVSALMEDVQVAASIASGGRIGYSHPVDVRGQMLSTLLHQGIPGDVVAGFSIATGDAVIAWANSISIPQLPLYPAFAAWPPAPPPPMPNVPAPLALLNQDLEPLSSSVLGESVLDALGSRRTLPEAGTSADRYANTMFQCFQRFISEGVLVGMVGDGNRSSGAEFSPVVGSASGGRFAPAFCGESSSQSDPILSTIDPDRPSIGAGKSATLRVTVVNDIGIPVPGVRVDLQSHGVASTLTIPAVTDGDGVTTAVLTSTGGGGPIVVLARADGTWLTDAAVVWVAPELPDISPTLTTITAVASRIPVGGSTSLEVDVRDLQGNPVSGVTVAFTTSGAAASITSSVTTDANGRGVATVTSTETAPGVILVNPVVTVPVPIPLPNVPILVIGEVSSARSTITASPLTVSRNGTSRILITARDIAGNPVSGADVVVRGSGAPNGAFGSLTGAPDTNSSGRSAVTLRAGRLVGTATVSARVNGIFIGSRVVTVTF